MEAPLGQKQRPHEFPSITLSHLSSPAPSSASASASFAVDNSGCPRLRIHQLSSPDPVFDLDLQNIQVFLLFPLLVCYPRRKLSLRRMCCLDRSLFLWTVLSPDIQVRPSGFAMRERGNGRR
ncbi:hypothetical protein BHE74_00056592 [Ensete ventricosum]|uniref:Probable histone-arginine methyltransferase CARM1-like N-terminal PH domain-containing protein n=1 Tax=Ensete ventricosum TaxID=4639 RepID=A0A444EWG9_ENSVE|nr:hypothetical protein B296_00054686 [Ensete ventricosum]RWW14717.1 hypothetical protein GW17_00021486 [Ensete ventricosum]RWW38197.1 hypothetical protein BHE74_00056592 [Ensete ventricosum]RZS27631.1 hypothetical protein BHM03_00061141 [Ensete ventricosum]